MPCKGTLTSPQSKNCLSYQHLQEIIQVQFAVAEASDRPSKTIVSTALRLARMHQLVRMPIKPDYSPATPHWRKALSLRRLQHYIH